MAFNPRRVAYVPPILLWALGGEEALCSAVCEESSCSNPLKTPVDFVAMADDLDALNRSTGNKLYEIPRVPCTGDWYLAEEPMILEGCCWALGSSFQKANEAVDCSGEEDFLPLDYFNISHQFLLEHCGEEDLRRYAASSLGKERAPHLVEELVTHLLNEPEKIRENIERDLRDTLNTSLAELNNTVKKMFTVAQYHALRETFKVRKRPEHILGYFHPVAHYPSRILYQCPAVQQRLRDNGFPLPSFYRPLRGDFERESDRESEWVHAAGCFIAPAASFAYPTHLHLADRRATALLLAEGKKHWQLVAMDATAYTELQPMEGVQRKLPTFHNPPIDLANDHEVYVGTQSKGEVLITPWNWAHLIFSIEDSVAILFD